MVKLFFSYSKAYCDIGVIRGNLETDILLQHQCLGCYSYILVQRLSLHLNIREEGLTAVFGKQDAVYVGAVNCRNFPKSG